MKINQLLKKATKKIAHISPTSQLDSEIILTQVLKKNHSFLLAHPEKIVSKKKVDKFFSLIKKRELSEPIAYIIGKKEFFGLNFLINKNVLIPREETEILVKKVINFFKHKKKGALIDLGTGSGAIAISIAKHIASSIDIKAIDICKKALNLAQKNAHNLATKNINFLQSDLLQNISFQNKSLPLVIVANLPYIGQNEVLEKSVLNFEPSKALFAGEKGLDLYDRLFEDLSKRKINFTKLFFEFAPEQKNYFQKILKQFFPNRNISFFKDLSGRFRGGEIE